MSIHMWPRVDVRSLWSFVRRIATDDAYERYLEHHRAHHPDSLPIDRREFYMREQQRKWTGIQRCC